MSAELDESKRLLYKRDAEKKKYENIIKEIDTFSSSHVTTCPTCYQPVNPDILKEARAGFVAKKEKEEKIIQEITQNINSLKEKITNNKNILSSLKDDLSDINRAKSAVSEIQNEIKSIKDSLSSSLTLPSINELEQEISDLSDKITDKKLAIREKEDAIKSNSASSVNIRELEFQENFLKLLENKIAEYKKELLQSKLNEIKDRIKDKWKQLWGKELWSIDFDKNFVPSISYKLENQTIQQSLRGLSGSEKIALSIVTRAAILEKLVERKILILDDPSIFLDDENIVKFAEFYKELIDNKCLDQIILTTFNSRFKELLGPDKVIFLEE